MGIMDIYGLRYARGPKKTYYAKKFDYTIAILFIQGKTYAENINFSLRFALE
jgi:hypothetical protein